MNQMNDQFHGKATLSHGLMLLNLLFPLLVYLVLSVFWLRHKKSTDNLLRLAVNQAWVAATISSFIFMVANASILIFAQYKSTFALITFEIYYVFMVPIFLIPGLLGLVKSNANLAYHYPLIGRYFR